MDGGPGKVAKGNEVRRSSRWLPTYHNHPSRQSSRICQLSHKMSICTFPMEFSAIYLPSQYFIVVTRVAQLVAAWQPGCKKMEREWKNEKEMEREWGNGERFTLKISSFSVYFLPLYPFPISKIVTFCRKMLYTALLSRMSQKTLHTRYKKIILGLICNEEGPQFVRACNQLSTFLGESYHETASFITNRRPYECWEY